MKSRTKKCLAFTAMAFVLYELIQVIRAPQADTRRIAREQQQRYGTWNGVNDLPNLFESLRRDW